MPDNTVHLKNTLDLPDDFIPYDKMLESPAGYVKKVVAATASPNPLKTRKQYYGRFIMRLFKDKLDGDCMFDPILSAMQRAGGESTSEMKVYVCVVWVEELQSYPFPEQTGEGQFDMELVRKIATNGGIFKSYTYLQAGGQDLEYGENVLVSFTDPGARKEGIFEYSLTKGVGTPGGLPTAGAGGGGPLNGGASGGAASKFPGGGYVPDACDSGIKVEYKNPAVKGVQEKIGASAFGFIKDIGAESSAKPKEKEGGALAGFLSAASADVKASMKKLMPKVFTLPEGPPCPGAFPEFPSKFPLVLDKRIAIKNKAEAKAAKGNINTLVTRYANYYNSRPQKPEKLAKGVMIVLHNTAGGRGRALKVNGQRLGKKSGKYQTFPSQNLEINSGQSTPVHFHVGLHNAYYNFDMNRTWGGGDQSLDGSRAGYPAIGIEIMHNANGVLGAPPWKQILVGQTYWNYSKSLGRGKWPMQTEQIKDSQDDNAFSRSNLGGSVMPPSQIAALRQCIQFIMAALQKKYGTRIIYIATHRNGYSSKPSCPGQYAIRHGIAPVMQSMGLRPLNWATPQTVDMGGGKGRYTGAGLLYPEVFFHDTIYETNWKGQPYLARGGQDFTRESGWNSMNRPLSLDEATKYFKQKSNPWYKGKGLK